ncbi:glycosyltransferase family 2 protein [Kocuria sp. M1R5S2]|uniref:glycosyltransferase family 2 protein n=1 Tax=Kocuria rhizosphaerae TaxID=3376285 RepID=UPI0037B4CE6A
MPRVSIIIPCYNDGQFLRESVMSALAQNFEELDVVVVDDGSTDKLTQDELMSIVELPRVMVVRQSNSGPAAARNRGISLSSAQYFLPLDADDVIEPQYVELCVRILDSQQAVGAVYSRADLIGDAEGEWRLPEFDWSTILVHNLVFNACLFRRNDWEAVGGYDETMRDGREDHDYILKVLGLGRTVWRLDEVCFHYRQRHSSRNKGIGLNREQLVAASAQIFRNNIALYEDKAEELFSFIYRQHDEIADLRHRYAALEAMRTRFPVAIMRVKRLTRFLR